MAPSVSKKRVSKKKKISWRKHCDTKDIDNFLEDKRLEERIGFSLSDKADEELFQIDTTANDLSQEANQKDFTKNLWNVDDSVSAERKSGLKQKTEKPLKCFEILIPQSAVQDPISKRNRVRTREERRHPLLRKLEIDRKNHGILKAKEIDAIRNRALADARRKNAPKRGDFTNDLWAGDADKADPLEGNSEWLNPTTLQHTLKNTGRMKKRIPKSLVKKTVLPAMELPHPGMSYNPTYVDHQNLLREVANKEVNLIKEEEHLNRVTTKMFSRVSRIDKDKSWLSEMSEGLPSTQDSKAEDAKDPDSEQNNEYTTVNPPVKNKKKTVQQRKKQKAILKEELKRKLHLLEKKKIADIYKLKFIEKHLESKESKLAKLREKRERVKVLKADDPKRLSKLKYEPPELDFNMPGDLRGNLRCIKFEGNLLNDRFKSLQRRNVLEPSKRHTLKKAKKKVYQKASHRMSWELT